MRHSKTNWFLVRCAAVTALIGSSFGLARACIVFVPPTLGDVSHADVVVIGRIANYRIVRDKAFRARVLSGPNLSADERKRYQDPNQGFLSDYARFDVQVEQILVGKVPAKLSVTWDNSTFGLPDGMKPSRYLIALRRPKSAMPPLRGPSATILPSPDASTLTVLQAPCSSAFIYEAESEQARAIRALLHAKQQK